MPDGKPENSIPSAELPSKTLTVGDLRHRLNQGSFFNPVEFRMYDFEYEIDEAFLSGGVFTITLRPKGVSR